MVSPVVSILPLHQHLLENIACFAHALIISEDEVQDVVVYANVVICNNAST
jgi:hypothetical protein